MNDYKGWANYATWRVCEDLFYNYIDNGDAPWHFDLDQESNDLGIDLKKYAQDRVDNGDAHGPYSLAVDYALAFLNEVDFRQIAKHVIDNHQQGEEKGAADH